MASDIQFAVLFSAHCLPKQGYSQKNNAHAAASSYYCLHHVQPCAGGILLPALLAGGVRRNAAMQAKPSLTSVAHGASRLLFLPTL